MKKILALLAFVASAASWAQTSMTPVDTPDTQVQNVFGNTMTLPNYGAGVLDSVYNSFVQSIGNVELGQYIAGLFWSLAAISLVWQLIQHALNRGEVSDVLATAVRWMLFTGIAWVFVAPGGWMWQQFTSVMFSDVAYSQGQVTPSGIVDIGISIMTSAASAIDIWTPMTWINGLISVGVFLLMLSVALEFLVLMIAANVYITVGVVCLGFAGSMWTKDFAFGYFKGIFIAALQILGLVVIINIAQSMFIHISSDLIYPQEVTPNGNAMWDSMLQAFIVGVAMKMLSGRIPSMLAGILSGNFAYSSGGTMGAAMAMGAGAVAMGAGAISLMKAGAFNKLTGGAMQMAGSGVNALAKAGLAADAAYRGGGSISQILGAGKEGLKSGYSEFSKAAGQGKDAAASSGGLGALGSTQSSVSPGAGFSASGFSGSGSNKGSRGEADSGNTSGSPNAGFAVGGNSGETLQGRSSGESGSGTAYGSNQSVTMGVGQPGETMDSIASSSEQGASASANFEHNASDQPSTVQVVGQATAAMAGGVSAIGNIDDPNHPSAAPNIGASLAEAVRSGQRSSSGRVAGATSQQTTSGQSPSGNSTGTVSPQDMPSSETWSQFAGSLNAVGSAFSLDAERGSAGDSTGNTSGADSLQADIQQTDETTVQGGSDVSRSQAGSAQGVSFSAGNGLGNAQASGAEPSAPDHSPQQASRLAQVASSGLSMLGKGMFTLGDKAKKQKIGKGIAYGLGAFGGSALGYRNFTSL